MPKRKNQAQKPHALGMREPLTPTLVQEIVLRNTPDDPQDPVDPDTQLRAFGIVDDDTAADHQAGIQSDLNNIGWHIKQADITSSPTTTVTACRDSVLQHAF